MSARTVPMVLADHGPWRSEAFHDPVMRLTVHGQEGPHEKKLQSNKSKVRADIIHGETVHDKNHGYRWWLKLKNVCPRKKFFTLEIFFLFGQLSIKFYFRGGPMSGTMSDPMTMTTTTTKAHQPGVP